MIRLAGRGVGTARFVAKPRLGETAVRFLGIQVVVKGGAVPVVPVGGKIEGKEGGRGDHGQSD